MFRQDIAEMSGFSMGSDLWKDSGCAISSVFHIAEQLSKRFYSPKRVQCICLDLKEDKYLSSDFSVLSWDSCFMKLGIQTITRFESARYICGEGEQEILKLQKPGYTHFVPGDGKGNYSWDSLGIRDSQKHYEIVEKRIIRILGVS